MESGDGLIVTEMSLLFAGRRACAGVSNLRELARRSDEETATKVSIRLHVHPDRARLDAPQRQEWPRSRRSIRGTDIQTIDHAIKRALDIIGSLTLLILLSRSSC